jgi:hypothetical protein
VWPEPRASVEPVAPLKRGLKDRDVAGPEKGGGDARRDAISLLIAYLKQETLDPLKDLGRFVLFGVIGSLAIGVGTVLLLIAALRVLQTETGAFHGNLSWLPYLIVAFLALTVIGAAGWRIVSGPAARRIPAKKSTD